MINNINEFLIKCFVNLKKLFYFLIFLNFLKYNLNLFFNKNLNYHKFLNIIKSSKFLNFNFNNASLCNSTFIHTYSL